MRVGNLFAAVLAGVLGGSFGAQAATVIGTADKSIYSVGETITITVLGSPAGGSAVHVLGRILYDSSLVSADGGQVQSSLGPGWILHPLKVDDPIPNSQDSFHQTGPGGSIPPDVTKKLTAIMSFTANAAGTAVFAWHTADGGFSFFLVRPSVLQR